MHSRIFEILMNKDDEPTMKNESFYHDFGYCSLDQYNIDYADDLEDGEYDESIDLLVETTNGGITYDKDTKAVKFDPKKIMADDYEQFVELANKLSKISLDQFANRAINTEGSAFWLKADLDSAYARENGFYFYNDEVGLYPMNEFLRQLDADKTYYLGNIMDYHY